MNSVLAPVDSDRDGMPDMWEFIMDWMHIIQQIEMMITLAVVIRI